MKKITILMLAFLAASCIEKSDVRPGSPVDVDIDHYQMAGTYDVPVKEGCITVVKAYGVTLAEAESPMTIWVPRMTLTRSDEGLTTTFVPRDEYPNFAGNKSQLFQVVCFEDSRRGDYDYNDLVIHVLYQTRQNIFGFGVQPVALGSTKSIKLRQAYLQGVDHPRRCRLPVAVFQVDGRDAQHLRQGQYQGRGVPGIDDPQLGCVEDRRERPDAR